MLMTTLFVVMTGWNMSDWGFSWGGDDTSGGDWAYDDASAASSPGGGGVSAAGLFVAIVSELLGLTSFLCVCLIVCTVRGAIRKRESIPSQCCGDCEDCCCTCCCAPCTMCQMMRHEKMGCVGDNNYSLCSPTGVPV